MSASDIEPDREYDEELPSVNLAIFLGWFDFVVVFVAVMFEAVFDSFSPDRVSGNCFLSSSMYEGLLIIFVTVVVGFFDSSLSSVVGT